MRGRPSTTMTGVGSLPRGVLARRLVRARASRRRPALDVALAEGRDPWSSGELMVRAAQLASWPERRQVAGALEGLVVIAERPLPVSPRFRIRRDAVLEQRGALLELATRLRACAPVDVVVVARLTRLFSDKSSPVYIGGQPPGGLADTTARCLQVVREHTNADG
jgi:hypothetical protein